MYSTAERTIEQRFYITTTERTTISRSDVQRELLWKYLCADRTHLFERNEARRVSGADARLAVLDWLVGDGKLAQVMPNHFRSNFNVRESTSVVNANYGANHFWNNNRISEVGLHWLGFVTRRRLALRFPELLDEVARTP
jgi:hypothetical protein